MGLENTNNKKFIPCCASKEPGGELIESLSSHLQGCISPRNSEALLSSRNEVLRTLSEDSKYLSGKY
jgi:hypothetical protein